jgi:hypothetical protein
VKKILKHPPHIYRDEGSFKKSPRDDRCAISGGRVSTLTFRGWHFLLKFWGFFVETDRRSQPASPRG